MIKMRTQSGVLVAAAHDFFLLGVTTIKDIEYIA